MKIDLRNVSFDAKAHYGVVSKTKLERERSVRFSNLYASEGSQVMGMEYHGKDVVAITCGDRGTFLLRAWTQKHYEGRWSGWKRPICLWWEAKEENGNPNLRLIRPETTKALVNKHRKQPAFDKDLEREGYGLFKGREKEKAAKGVFGCFQSLFKKWFGNK